MSAILALESGHVFHGNSIGVSGRTLGELVFNTSITGYEEVITDPSYTQQIVSFTYPHIGNTGINFEDAESNKPSVAGIVVRELSKIYSNWRAKISLQEYLINNNLIAISGVDTRGVTKILRKHGSLNACIVAGENISEQTAIDGAREFLGLSGMNLASGISKNKLISKSRDGVHIVVIDFGLKHSILKYVKKFTNNISIVPADTSATEIINLSPDGILLSNGPGDPEACTEIISNIKQLIKSRFPIMGICLGYQLLALALDYRTYKMSFGHHGTNHPVIDIDSKEIMITSQNHGFAVDEKSLNCNAQVTHRSLFDGTVQGIKHLEFPIFGFQGHPEAGPGPIESAYLFSKFFELCEKCQEEMI